MGTAGHLDTHLPGTQAALRDGTLSLGKARLIATATGLLDEAEAAAAEAEVLDRAGRLTPGGLRAAIARAVMEAAPRKAKKRRETAAKFARVERWAEDSGNAALAGRELSPDQVLAADERITARARELKAAGLEGGTDELRARALLDLLLGQDSRPRQDQDSTPGAAPAGFASRVTLTAPLATLTRLAGRPGELVRARPGRPLADPRPGHRRRAQPQDHLVRDRHRREGARRRPRLRPPRTQESPETRRPGARDGPGFAFEATADPRTWRLRTPGPGPDLIITIEPGHHRPLRPPARSQRPRSRGQAAAPVPGPARHLHQPHLPAARRPVRPGAQHPLRSRRADLPLQHRPEMSPRPPPQAAPQVESGPAPRRHLPVDHPIRADLHHRTHPIPHLNPGRRSRRHRGNRTGTQDCLRSAIQVNGWMVPAGVQCSSRSWLISSHPGPTWRASCAGL